MSPATTDRKIEANRLNATLSTGPKSEEGKQTSARNAISHGLTSRRPLLPNEDPAHYDTFLQDYRNHYRPNTPFARELVTELAELRWRLLRVPIFEAQVLNLETRAITLEEENAHRDSHEILAIAYERLIKRKVLQNLYSQEGRLCGRVAKIQKVLQSVEQRQIDPPPPVLTPSEETQIEKTSKNEPICTGHQPGRNEHCPCGSGLKFKRCCLNQSITTMAAAA